MIAKLKVRPIVPTKDRWWWWWWWCFFCFCFGRWLHPWYDLYFSITAKHSGLDLDMIDKDPPLRSHSRKHQHRQCLHWKPRRENRKICLHVPCRQRKFLSHPGFLIPGCKETCWKKRGFQQMWNYGRGSKRRSSSATTRHNKYIHIIMYFNIYIYIYNIYICIFQKRVLFEREEVSTNSRLLRDPECSFVSKPHHR